MRYKVAIRQVRTIVVYVDDEDRKVSNLDEAKEIAKTECSRAGGDPEEGFEHTVRVTDVEVVGAEIG